MFGRREYESRIGLEKGEEDICNIADNPMALTQYFRGHDIRKLEDAQRVFKKLGIMSSAGDNGCLYTPNGIPIVQQFRSWENVNVLPGGLFLAANGVPDMDVQEFINTHMEALREAQKYLQTGDEVRDDWDLYRLLYISPDSPYSLDPPISNISTFEAFHKAFDGEMVSCRKGGCDPGCCTTTRHDEMTLALVPGELEYIRAHCSSNILEKCKIQGALKNGQYHRMGKCVDPNRGCTLPPEAKPVVCRMFPFLPTVFSENGVLASYCPEKIAIAEDQTVIDKVLEARKALGLKDNKIWLRCLKRTLQKCQT